MVGFNEMENAVAAAKTRRKYFSAFTNQYSSKKPHSPQSVSEQYIKRIYELSYIYAAAAAATTVNQNHLYLANQMKGKKSLQNPMNNKIFLQSPKPQNSFILSNSSVYVCVHVTAQCFALGRRFAIDAANYMAVVIH